MNYKRITTLALIGVASSGLLASERVFGQDQSSPNIYHVCTKSQPLKLRDKPNQQVSSEIDLLPRHTEVELVRRASNTNWSLVRTESGQEGYMASRYLCEGLAPTTNPGQPVPPQANDNQRVVLHQRQSA